MVAKTPDDLFLELLFEFDVMDNAVEMDELCHHFHAFKIEFF